MYIRDIERSLRAETKIDDDSEEIDTCNFLSIHFMVAQYHTST